MQTRVLHLVNEFNPASTNRRVLNLIAGLDRDRYVNHVGCVKRPDGPMADEFQGVGAEVINFGKSAGKFGYKLFPQLAHYIREQNINIVHTHALRADLMGGLAVRLMRDRPVLLASKGNTSYIPNQKGWLARNILYWPVMYLPDKIITVSEAMRNQIIDRLRLKSNRIMSLHTGIEIDSFYKPETRDACREKLGIAPGDFVATYTGRLVTGKGLDNLLNAVPQFANLRKQCRVLIVGEGPLRESLQKQVQELDIASHVVFTGFRSDIPEILAATDVFVLPSLSEGLPQSIMEAMSAGKAVVATSVGGVVELIEPETEKTGILIPPRNPQALAKALGRLCENQHLCEELGRNARAFMRRHFSTERMVRDYDKLYQHMREIHLTR